MPCRSPLGDQCLEEFAQVAGPILAANRFSGKVPSGSTSYSSQFVNGCPFDPKGEPRWSSVSPALLCWEQSGREKHRPSQHFNGRERKDAPNTGRSDTFPTLLPGALTRSTLASQSAASGYQWRFRLIRKLDRLCGDDLKVRVDPRPCNGFVKELERLLAMTRRPAVAVCVSISRMAQGGGRCLRLSWKRCE